MFTTIVDVIYLNSAGLAFVDVTDLFSQIDLVSRMGRLHGQREFNDQADYSKGTAPSSRNLDSVFQ